MDGVGGSMAEHLASHGTGLAGEVADHGAQGSGGAQAEHLASHGTGTTGFLTGDGTE